MENTIPFVFIEPLPEERKVKLTWKFSTYFNELEGGGVSCYISAFDIYFSGQSKEVAKTKSSAIMKSYFHHFLGHSEKGRLRKLVIQLHKLGFKTANDTMTIKKFIDNHAVKAKFNSINNIIPESFSKDRQMIQEEELAVNA
jgi:hypothetical protein